MKLIDKNKLLEELKKLKQNLSTSSIATIEDVESLVESLEVKEVDLEKEIKNYFDSQPIITRSKGIDYQLIPTGVDIAKHFFELGIKAQKGE